jgi:hypothetical protein
VAHVTPSGHYPLVDVAPEPRQDDLWDEPLENGPAICCVFLKGYADRSQIRA